MRVFAKSLVIAAAVLNAPIAASAALPPGHFGWMADLAGSCWRATYPDGKTTDTQCYSTQYDRYLRGTIEIRSEKGAYRGDSFFVWNPAKSSMEFHYWSDGGQAGVSSGFVEGSTILFPDPPSTDPAKPDNRTVWTRLSPNSYRVTQQLRSGNEWRDGMVVTYTRQGLVDEHGVSADCSAPEFHRLDYLIGEWDVVETRSGKHFLHNRVEAVNGGCAVRETLLMRDGVPGSSLNFYSPSDKRWHTFYHSPNLYAVLEGPPVAAGRHEVRTRIVVPGDKQPALVRQITSRDARGRPRQVGIAIADDGKTTELWDLTFCSLKAGADRSAPCDTVGSTGQAAPAAETP